MQDSSINIYDLFEGAVSAETKHSLMLRLDVMYDESKQNINALLQGLDPNLLQTLQVRLPFKPSHDDGFSPKKIMQLNAQKDIDDQFIYFCQQQDQYLMLIEELVRNVVRQIELRQKMEDLELIERHETSEKEKRRLDDYMELQIFKQKEDELQELRDSIILEQLEYEKNVLVLKQNELLEESDMLQAELGQVINELSGDNIANLRALANSNGETIFDNLNDDELQKLYQMAVKRYLRAETNKSDFSNKNSMLFSEPGEDERFKNNVLQDFIKDKRVQLDVGTKQAIFSQVKKTALNSNIREVMTKLNKNQQKMEQTLNSIKEKNESKRSIDTTTSLVNDVKDNVDFDSFKRLFKELDGVSEITQAAGPKSKK